MKITQQEFGQRRRALMSAMEPNSIAILASSKACVRSRDTEFIFRQSSDILYLTGFEEPESVVVLIPGRAQGEFVMFCRDKDKAKEIWDGFRAGPEGACGEYGADEAHAIAEIDQVLPGLIDGRERVYYAVGHDAEFDNQLMEWVNVIRAQVRSGAAPPEEFINLSHLLHKQRLRKSPAELKLMAESAEIAAKAHVRAMQSCAVGRYEYQLEADLLHAFALSGARNPAYTTIVGGGANACVLHYVTNRALLQDGDLVLIDAGCEFQYYASDITRTFPVNGVFSEAQKTLYNIVLQAQLAAIAEVKPGNHWNQSHDASVRVITQGLIDHGLLHGELDHLIETGAYKEFYMHKIGHWLGMDVHDVGDYKVKGQWRALEPGMVMTVEPGLYVAPDNESVDKKWRGIGIRIEDDVAVTEAGCDILSAGVPKTVAEIEALMAASAGVTGAG